MVPTDRRHLVAATVLLLAGLAPSSPARAFSPADIAPNTWVSLSVPTPVPNERGWNRGVYNPLNRTMILYDGSVDADHPYTIYSNTIWSYDFVANRFTLKTLSPWHGGENPSDWYLVTTCNDPCQWSHPYDRHPYGGFVYDTAADVMVLFGGVNARSGMQLFDDTWVYNPATNSWRDMQPASHPPAREEACMVYAPSSDETIVMDGSCASCGDVWGYKYATNTWTRKDYAGQLLPPGRRTHSMIFIPSLNRVMLFGGKSYDEATFFGDTWLYDAVANQWSNAAPPSTPPGRLAPGLAYDTQNRAVMMFGGYGSGGPLGDTWIYHPDVNRWEQLSPPNSPGALGRNSWRLIYDESDGVFLLWETAATVWAYKYVPSGQPLDAVAPGSVRDLITR